MFLTATLRASGSWSTMSRTTNRHRWLPVRSRNPRVIPPTPAKTSTTLKVMMSLCGSLLFIGHCRWLVGWCRCDAGDFILEEEAFEILCRRVVDATGDVVDELVDALGCHLGLVLCELVDGLFEDDVHVALEKVFAPAGAVRSFFLAELVRKWA